MQLSIAYFITSHGFGHAARALAVMNAIYARWPFVRFEIFTLTPEWFFGNILKVPHTYHCVQTDVGLIQSSPLHADLDKTMEALEAFLPFRQKHIEDLSDTICAAHCHLVISDISPLGIAVAKHAGIISVLVENFTWDWIYEAYAVENPRFQKHVDLLVEYFGNADLRIQAAPVCHFNNGHLCTPPISRTPTSESRLTRERLGISGQAKMVLITMGGISGHLPFIGQLAAVEDNICFVVPGTAVDLPLDGKKQGNVIFLPQNSTFFHPDLVQAADAVIGKVGSSTLAEIFHSGVPYGFIPRLDFRESPVLEAYINQNMVGVKFSEAEFNSGAWLKRLPELLQLPKQTKEEPNGADVAAEYICNYLACEEEILDIVDTQGCVIGAAPRKCVHGNNQMLHQVVHVLVYNNDNHLLLQKRSVNKRVAPGRWDTSVGGHVDCGESIETAMYREMTEELGIHPQSLQFAYQYIHCNDFESELVFTYTCQHDGAIVFNPEEIDAVRFWEMKEIEENLGKGVLSDNFEDEFKRYRRWLEIGAGE